MNDTALTLRLPDDLHQRLRVIAKMSHRSLNNLMVVALEEWCYMPDPEHSAVHPTIRRSADGMAVKPTHWGPETLVADASKLPPFPK